MVTYMTDSDIFSYHVDICCMNSVFARKEQSIINKVW